MRWRQAVGSLILGLLIVIAAQGIAPIGSPPLYDGVVVLDPYLYLLPGPGELGSPTSYKATQALATRTSPAIAAATAENPPQAQLIAGSDTFLSALDGTSLTIAIDPVAPVAAPTTGPIAGNVYRLAVTDGAGASVSLRPGKRVTVVLRAPGGVPDATIAQYTAGGWQRLPTAPGGQPGIFLTNVDTLGDFALLATPGPGLDPRLVVGGLLLAAANLAVLLIAVTRQNRRPIAPTGSPSSDEEERRTKRRQNGRP